jgi:NAD(P)-dependent dehydrogenase (short-subunit alcohol dehydrogenase family)
MGKLDGKVAVVTGANSGIGFATAKRFADEGAYVFITGRRQNELDAAMKNIGKNVTGVQGDVSNLKDLDRLFETVKKEKGHVDILFANAGIGEFAPLESITEEHFDKTFGVNVKGVIFSVQKALPLLRENASIMFNASIAGSKASPSFSVYGATKAALRSLVRSFAVELKDRKIRINAISPGPINTPGFDGLGSTPQENAAFRQAMTSMTPMGRFGDADEVAKVASFLASDDASFITGIELFVDGGAAQV